MGLSTSVVDGVIYAIGGTDSTLLGFSTVEAYDPATATWTTLADMPTARAFFSTSVIDSVIYAIGGTIDAGSFQPLSTVEAYDSATDTWTTLADMPTARHSLSTAVVDGIIYAIGGSDRTFLGFSTVEAYNPTTNTWTTGTEMPTGGGLGLPSGGIIDGKIYVIGGFENDSFVPIATVRIYDSATDTWTTGTDMPTARGVFSTSVVDGQIYAIGGSDGGSSNNFLGISSVEVYDSMTGTWTTESDMPTPRARLSTSAVNGTIYAIGGGQVWSTDAFPTVEAFTPVSITAVSPQGRLTTTWGSIKNVP